MHMISNNPPFNKFTLFRLVYLHSSVLCPSAQTVLSDWMNKKLRLELEMDEEEDDEDQTEEQPANLNYKTFNGTALCDITKKKTQRIINESHRIIFPFYFIFF